MKKKKLHQCVPSVETCLDLSETLDEGDPLFVVVVEGSRAVGVVMVVEVEVVVEEEVVMDVDVVVEVEVVVEVAIVEVVNGSKKKI